MGYEKLTRERNVGLLDRDVNFKDMQSDQALVMRCVTL